MCLCPPCTSCWPCPIASGTATRSCRTSRRAPTARCASVRGRSTGRSSACSRTASSRSTTAATRTATCGGATTKSPGTGGRWRWRRRRGCPRCCATPAPSDWSPRRSEAMRVRDRLARALIRLYPAEFRDEYAGEMEQLMRDQSRDGGSVRWSDLVADIVRTAPREHGSVLMNDLRYAARVIGGSPVFSAAVVLPVALAIGANPAIFSVVNAVMLQPLPFDHPKRLVQVNEKNEKLNLPNFGASVLNYLSWKEQTRTLDIAAFG